MGIHGSFSRFLIGKFRPGFCAIFSQKYRFIFIDISAILHSIGSGYQRSSALKKVLFSRLRRLVNRHRHDAGGKVMIGLDGSAPFAKMFQQRFRREQIARKLYLSSKSSKNRSQSSKNNRQLFSLSLTPGTQLMNYIDDWMLKMRHSKSGNPTEFRVSTSKQAGEAEHKILRELLLLSNDDDDDDDKKLIISGDSDVYVQLILSGARNVEFLNLSLAKQDRYLFSIDRWLKKFERDLFQSNNITTDKHKLRENRARLLERARRDFGFLCLLVGNDYLPRLGGCRIDGLWRWYLHWFSHHASHSMNRDFFLTRSDLKYQSPNINLENFHQFLIGFRDKCLPRNVVSGLSRLSNEGLEGDNGDDLSTMAMMGNTDQVVEMAKDTTNGTDHVESEIVKCPPVFQKQFVLGNKDSLLSSNDVDEVIPDPTIVLPDSLCITTSNPFRFLSSSSSSSISGDDHMQQYYSSESIKYARKDNARKYVQGLEWLLQLYTFGRTFSQQHEQQQSSNRSTTHYNYPYQAPNFEYYPRKSINIIDLINLLGDTNGSHEEYQTSTPSNNSTLMHAPDLNVVCALLIPNHPVCSQVIPHKTQKLAKKFVEIGCEARRSSANPEDFMFNAHERLSFELTMMKMKGSL